MTPARTAETNPGTTAADLPEELENALAVVGLAGRFPGASNVAEFWRNLCAGVESVTFFSPEELAAAGVPESVYSHPSYVPAKARLDGVELFDAEFFGFNAHEAEMTDPQHRLFLECAWEALEDAAYDPARFPGRIG
ncbi:beta-ketoacyl synthase N-terminal-like domain-containing protein, partial [Micromonospora sp. NPDC047670]